MALNPNYRRVNSGSDVGTVKGSELNNPDYVNQQGYNTFSLSRQNCMTLRFGEITPFFSFYGVPGDKLNMKSSHEIRTHTLASPLMSSMKISKDVFYVPLKAVMPHTFDYLYSNPVQGDDVPDDAYCKFPLGSLLSSIGNLFKSPIEPDEVTPKHIYLLVLLYHLAQCGSLLETLDCRRCLTSDIDRLNRLFDEWLVKFIPDGTNPHMQLNIEFFDVDLETNSSRLVGNIVFGETGETLESLRRKWFYLVSSQYAWMPYTLLNIDLSLFTFVLGGFWSHREDTIDISPVVAYQMSCAQFFSNDSIDYIYTSKLWMQNMESLASVVPRSVAPGADTYPYFFSYNGLKMQYDVFSEFNFKAICSYLVSASGPTRSSTSLDIPYWSAFYFLLHLFTFRNNLRYGDYFTTARTQPLAVGDVDIVVTGDKVNTIDVTQNLLKQRLLNALNRVGSKLKDQIKGLFGVDADVNEPAPQFVSHESFFIGSNEVANTSSDQGNLVTNVLSQNSNYMFEVYLDQPCIILGLASFDLSVVYETFTQRQYFHENRYDWYNPMMQNVGDQQIYPMEIFTDSLSIDKAFGYQMQDAEYKNAVSVCSGGFHSQLPGYAFTYKPERTSLVGATQVINPEFIRYYQTFLDRYYKSLTGLSLDSYFHFIISFINDVTANRKMDYKPSILF